ncbi:hypothetical protein Baya_15699 [Bagarius yarrelli]|uniref:Uncharacterized protein n=1 Tax=Bagarius yarrelli TaxID=175774 RepID=A0A556VCJ6_BAGYA|nr:hypothetical protein Baya_15699 [Bagarius yarrelli]
MAVSGTAQHWWPWFNMSDPASVELKDYQEWYHHYGSQLGSHITDCNLEREMNKGSESSLEYPGWALVMLALLITFASLPVPAVYIHSLLTHKESQSHAEGVAEHHREQYRKCSTTEPELNSHHATPDENGSRPRSAFLPVAGDHYRLLSQQEDGEEEEDDTEL